MNANKRDENKNVPRVMLRVWLLSPLTFFNGYKLLIKKL